MASIVKVAIESPIPQLDKLFDYLVPDDFRESLRPGMRLIVPFGRSKKPTHAFAIDITDSSESYKLSEISEIVSTAVVLKPEIYLLCRAVADRQAATLNDVLKLAVPSRSVRVEKQWLETPSDVALDTPGFTFDGQVELAEPKLAFTPMPWMAGNYPAWVAQFIATALGNLTRKQSTIIVVPDARDQNSVLKLLKEIHADQFLVHYRNDQTPSQKYQEFLSALSGPRIILGSRAAIFAPAQNLASILVYNDGDSSLIEPTSPYLATREIALVRQQQQSCQLVFAGAARSCEVERLVQIGYLAEQTATPSRPKVAVTASEVRVDSLAYQGVRKALDQGGSALIQVSSAGTAVSLFCSKCSEKFQCKLCNGPIGLDSGQKPKCRWCGSFNLDLACFACGTKTFRQGRPGVTRTAAEFGRSFPGALIVEASGEKRVLELAKGKKIVVATPGAEPVIEGGYDTVILLDATNLLARDTLRATENAVRQWADAVVLMKSGGQAILVGVPGKLGQQFALWNLNQIAEQELSERRELGFPPHVRIATVTAQHPLAERVVDGLQSIADGRFLEVLGPIASGSEQRYVIRYDYGLGAALAQELKTRSFTVGAGLTRQSEKGRISRAIRLKMDDAEVI